MSSMWLVLLLSQVLSPSAQAVRDAQARFDAGDFEGALTQLDAALSLELTPAVRAQLHLTRAECFAAKRQFPQVDAAFAAALQADPEVRLDPAQVTPALIGMLDTVRDRLRGTLQVACDGEAVISVDGVLFGTCPGEGRVRVGRHQIEARSADGTRRSAREVVVFPDAEIKVALELTATAPRAVSIVVSLGATLDPLAFGQRGSPVGAELGAGVAGALWLFSIHGAWARGFALSGRGGLRVPRLLGPLGFSVSADVTVLFTPELKTASGDVVLVPAGAALALGPRGGLLLELPSFFEAFLDGGYSHAFVDARYFTTDYVLLTLGLRALF